MKKLIHILIIFCMLAFLGSQYMAQNGNVLSVFAQTETGTVLEEEDVAAEDGNEPAITSVDKVDFSDTHEDAFDAEWSEADAISIQLNGDSISAENESVVIDGTTVTIVTAGSYLIQGKLNDGQIVVNSEDEGPIKLILNNVEITDSKNAAIMIENADKAIIILADGSTNILNDASETANEATDENRADAALYSKADLSIYGSGSLVVNGNYKEGISVKDGLIIGSGDITIQAVEDGIYGKDYLVVGDGRVTVTAGKDGLKSENEDDTSQGFIEIRGGEINITSDGDSISAGTDIRISGGTIHLSGGGGSSVNPNEEISGKGIKASGTIQIDGGTISVDASDDAIHSDTKVIINDGSFSLASGDDGIHADNEIEINNGQILIKQSEEGIESAVITINSGTIDITSKDDGMNASDGSGEERMGPGGSDFFGGRGMGQRPVDRGQAPENMDAVQNPIAPQSPDINNGENQSASSIMLTINGGLIIVNAGGDGLDSNGSIGMSGGTVLVNGPTNSGNGSLDYMGTFDLSGGTVVAVGSAGMAQGSSADSSQNSIMINFDAVQAANTLFSILDQNGNVVIAFEPVKQYQSVFLTTPVLKAGETYTVRLGGTCSGTEQDHLYTDGTVIDGTVYTTFEMAEGTTQIGTFAGRGMMRK
ncbi:MAG TPA: carbohydrate-binding domain-containing protein [Flexilinea sp.]|nr:carbohydrate-binding domain-containing protein [Flexilinea sp.]